jgi:hypothetical protein
MSNENKNNIYIVTRKTFWHFLTKHSFLSHFTSSLLPYSFLLAVNIHSYKISYLLSSYPGHHHNLYECMFSYLNTIHSRHATHRCWRKAQAKIDHKLFIFIHYDDICFDAIPCCIIKLTLETAKRKWTKCVLFPSYVHHHLALD